MHGLSRAVITKAQGGRWSSGFWSGLAGSALGTFMGTLGKVHIAIKTAINSIASGLISKITGGKFANGAVTGAFVYLFNHALHEAQAQVRELSKQGYKMTLINDGSGKNGYFAVNGDYASVINGGISTEVLNVDYRDCIDSFSCSVLKGMYDIGGDVNNLFDALEIGTNTPMDVLNVLKKGFKIIARPIGAIAGAQKYYENKNRQEEK